MTCQAIMTARPLTLREGDTVGAAARQLIEQRHIILPVVDDRGRYLGLFGVFDLVKALLPRVATLDDLVPDLSFLAEDMAGLHDRFAELGAKPVGAFARKDMPVLRPDMPVVEALLLFYRNRSTLPVVEEATGRLLGVVSYWDALSAIAGGNLEPEA
jgi:CBS domain-containing protein